MNRTSVPYCSYRIMNRPKEGTVEVIAPILKFHFRELRGRKNGENVQDPFERRSMGDQYCYAIGLRRR